MGLGAPGGTGPGEGGIGGVPGGIGAVGPGVAGIGVGADFGGLIGRGDRGLFSGKAGKPGVTAEQLDALMAVIPVFGMGNLALSGLNMGLGQFAVGDPSSGRAGVSGSEGGGGVGGGPAQSNTVRKIQNALAAPVLTATPPEPPGVDPDLQRRRVGRQETILTSGSLSEVPTLKPTLLGQ